MDSIAEEVEQLLDEAYATTLDPLRYGALMLRWEHYLRVRAAAETQQHGSTERTLERHFTRALSILDRLHAAAPANAKTDAALAALPVAALILQRDGTLIAHNPIALGLLAPAGGPVCERLEIDVHARKLLTAWLNKPDPGASACSVPCRIGPDQRSGCMIVQPLDATARDKLGLATHPHELFLLATLDLRLDDDIGGAIAVVYGLTSAEVDVALALARGTKPTAVARDRGVSLNTVRTQIKVLLRKLGADAMPDLVRMLAGFAACRCSVRGLGTSSGQPAGENALQRSGSCRLPDGRKLAYEESGARSGRPVVFLHNMLHGPSLPAAAVEAACRRGLRIIAPSRPGFGDSDTLRGLSGAALVDRVASDCLHLLDQLGIDRALVLGHLSGGVYALRLAERAPRRAYALLLASYLPAWDDARMSKLSTRARVMAEATRQTPRLLPFLAAAGSAHIHAGCEDQLLAALHGDQPLDLKALREPEIHRVVVKGMRHCVKQGGRAFCLDAPLILTDWSARAARIHQPAHVVLGEHDMFARPEAVREFNQRAPQFGISSIPDAGVYALYTHAALFFDALDQLHAAAHTQV